MEKGRLRKKVDKGAVIRNARLEAGLSILDLSKLSGVPKGTLYKWENNYFVTIKKENIKKISKFINVDVLLKSEEAYIIQNLDDLVKIIIDKKKDGWKDRDIIGYIRIAINGKEEVFYE